MNGSHARRTRARNFFFANMFLMPAAAITVQARPCGLRSPVYRR